MDTSEDGETLESHGSEMGRESGASPVEWFLVNGSRLLVAAAVLLGVGVWFLGLDKLGVIAFQNDDSITRLAGGMIAGTFSLVTLVVSINQMILSQEFNSAGEARDELSGVMGFREEIEDASDAPASPASPVALFYLLVDTIHERADTLGESVDGGGDGGPRALIESYVSGVHESTTNVADTLESSSFGTFDVVAAAADYNDAWQIYAARRLKSQHGDELSEETVEAFDDLLDTLELFNIARTHFKTTYMQRELTKFSRETLYCGVPSVFAAMTIGFLYGGVGGAVIAPPLLPYAVTALLLVVASPLALMASYVLRMATLARRTASIGPMIPQKAPEDDPFELAYDEE
ncbi:hypothetical protein [Halalkalicoccus tibetensis]|uniref:Uncharacterized protein n=1 Tax=Halalkalicoccus tibetensis TaxID=175632 RepID=A0ABD5UXG0_9EURY